jgi:peptidoglycan-N-acetylglucosamine deacetylase
MMHIKRYMPVMAFLYLLSSQSFAVEYQIAITIDDLPFVGSGTSTPAGYQRTHDRFMAIVKALSDNQVPATGFIIGEAVAKNEWSFLEEFRTQGLTLGNHTYTHKNLSSLSAENYIKDIQKADDKLANVMTAPKFFRYPYLDEGKGVKRQKVQAYLAEHGYTIAPVTIDSKDYRFNELLYNTPYRLRGEKAKQIEKRYLDYIWKETLRANKQAKKMDGQPVKQILLIHANFLNSYCLPAIIEMYKRNGYTFITLSEALKKN